MEKIDLTKWWKALIIRSIKIYLVLRMLLLLRYIIAFMALYWLCGSGIWNGRILGRWEKQQQHHERGNKWMFFFFFFFCSACGSVKRSGPRRRLLTTRARALSKGRIPCELLSLYFFLFLYLGNLDTLGKKREEFTNEKRDKEKEKMTSHLRSRKLSSSSFSSSSSILLFLSVKKYHLHAATLTRTLSIFKKSNYSRQNIWIRNQHIILKFK